MKQVSLFLRGALCAAAFGLGACGGDEGGTTPDANPGGGDAGPAVTSGTYNHYATSSLKVGATASEAMSFAFDVDGNGRADNALGTFLSIPAVGADSAISNALSMGDFIILHSVRADNLTSDSTVSWRILLGEPQASPKYDGTGSFSVSTESPRDAVVTGAIAGGKFTGGPASVTIEVAVTEGGEPVRLELNAVRLEASVTADGCVNGRLGGAVESDKLLDEAAPVLATELTARIQADEGCATNISDCDGANGTIRGFLDVNPSNGIITVQEITEVAGVLLSPDVDVLGADGRPGKDSVLESVSMAVGFTCVKGAFSATDEN